MKFRPLHDRVVVRRIDAEEKTAGGIIIPDTAKEKPQQGEVLAVGPGKRDETGKLVALDVREGDQILFGKWSGTEVRIDGEDLLIMKEDDIMGVVEGRAAMSKGSGASTTRRVGAVAAVLALGLLATLPFVGF
jgi:chaperonin GroES